MPNKPGWVVAKTEEELLTIWNYYKDNPNKTTAEIGEHFGVSQPAMAKMLSRVMKKFTKVSRDAEMPDITEL